MSSATNAATQLFRLEQAATALGISHWTLRSWAKRGLLKTIRLGRLKMVSQSEVDRIAQEGVAARHLDWGTQVASPKGDK